MQSLNRVAQKIAQKYPISQVYSQHYNFFSLKDWKLKKQEKNIQNHLQTIHYNVNKGKPAQQIIQELESVEKMQLDLYQKPNAKYWNTVLFKLVFQQELGEYQKVKQSINQILEDTEGIDNNQGELQFKAYQMKGIQEGLGFSIEERVNALLKANNLIYKFQREDSVDQAAIQQQIGELYMQGGYLKESEESLKKACDIYDEVTRKKATPTQVSLKLMAYISLGQLYACQSLKSKSLSTFRRAQDIVKDNEKQLNWNPAIIRLNLSQGKLYTDQGDFDLGKKFINKGYEEIVQLSKKTNLMDKYYFEGILYKLKINIKEGDTEFNQELFEKLQSLIDQKTVPPTYKALLLESQILDALKSEQMMDQIIRFEETENKPNYISKLEEVTDLVNNCKQEIESQQIQKALLNSKVNLYDSYAKIWSLQLEDGEKILNNFKENISEKYLENNKKLHGLYLFNQGALNMLKGIQSQDQSLFDKGFDIFEQSFNIFINSDKFKAIFLIEKCKFLIHQYKFGNKHTEKFENLWKKAFSEQSEQFNYDQDMIEQRIETIQQDVKLLKVSQYEELNIKNFLKY